MAPPPDTMGDEFPDFDNMTPDEQMAWLESLARRQGADDDELTTAADVEIPVPDDVELDEPGYIPFEGSRSGREWAQHRRAAEDGLPAAGPDASELPSADDDVELIDFDDLAPADEDADPMHWLETLAAQPGADSAAERYTADTVGERPPDESESFVTTAESDTDDAGTAALEPEQPVTHDEELPASAGETQREDAGDDPLGGVDPLAWLETLAKRQGANLSELTTGADLDIAEVPDDAIIDEPGYVPFEGSRSAREMGLAPPPDAPDWELEPDEEHEVLALDEAHTTPGAEENAPERDEPLLEDVGAVDAVRAAAEATPSETQGPVVPTVPADELEAVAEWDASLAEEDSRAADEPVVTEGVSSEATGPIVPTVPDDELERVADWKASLDEGDSPDYAEPELGERAAIAAGESSEPAASADELEAVAEWEASLADQDDPLAGADPINWLESLAKRQGASEHEFTTSADLDVPAPPDDVEIDEPGYVPFSALDILSPDHEVPEEIFAHAERLAAEAEDADSAFGDELLSWLEEIALEPGADAAEYLAAPHDERPFADPLSGLTDEDVARLQMSGQLSGEQELAWLKRQAAQLAETRERAADDERAGEVTPALPAELPDWLEEMRATHDELAEELSASELDAFLAAGLVPAVDEIDSLAEALDDEYDRLSAGDESEPDWYTEAVARAASEETLAGEPVLAPAELIDLPGWLADAGEGRAPQVGDELPDWLMEAGLEEPPSEAEVPDWLVERMVEAEAGAETGILNDWLSDLDQGPGEPAPAQAGTTRPLAARLELPEPPATAHPTAPVPEGRRFEPFRQRLEHDPSDHASRLELARSLHADQALDQSLDQYEVLVEAAEMLDDISGDLQTIVKEHEEAPRVHRLLGDAHMRSGRLHEALDAYRAALNRL